MKPSLWAFALTLGAVMVLAVGCEKPGPAASNPGPTVIVEQPGDQPGAQTEAGNEGDPESTTTGADSEAGTMTVVTTDVPCQSDADCVKDSCCHATSCVAVADAPNCAGAVCTMDCQAGTMDCNGGCMCQAGHCAAQLWTAP